jgi:anthranilate synthase component 2
VISPGPCTPTEAGISVEVVKQFAGRTPLLGVCLGHQSIGQATGGKIVRARELMHGKTDQILHTGTGLFAGIESPMIATRYHSLVIQPDTLSADFEMIGWAIDQLGNREIMAVQHRSLPVFGLQFHPESFLTERGVALLENFLKTAV